MEVSMNNETAIWNELNGIFLTDGETDAIVAAYQFGDLTEMGRIIATHINYQLSSRAERLAAYDKRIAEGERYVLTEAGEHAARLMGGVL